MKSKFLKFAILNLFFAFSVSNAFAIDLNEYFGGGRGYTCKVDVSCPTKLSTVYRDGQPSCVGIRRDGNYMACEGTEAAAQAKELYYDPSNMGPPAPNQGPTLTGAPLGEESEEGETDRSPSGTSSEAIGDGCETFDEGIQSCQTEHDSAMSRCDDKNDPDMASAGRTATMAANAVSTATAASMQMACSKMKDVSMTMQAALTGFKAACESARSSCVSTCGAASNDISNYPQCAHKKASISKQLSECKKLDGQMAQINYGLQSMMATHLNAKQCASMSVADNKDFCAANPSSPICKTEDVNCNDPKMSATNPVCICMNNPHDPVCGAGGRGASAANSYGVNGSGGSGVNGKLGGMGTASSLGGLMGGKGGKDPFADAGTNGEPGVGKGSNPVEAGNGGGSRGLAGGGGSGGNGLGGSGDYGSNGSRGKGNTAGFYGGGGGAVGPGGSGGYGSGGSGGGGYYGSNPQYKQAGQGKPDAQVDLRQFLPKSRPNMMLGMTGPDGITGPTSDIWTKINFRYMSIRPSMRP